MLPSVDDVLSQLSGAKVFSKLDASGIRPDPEKIKAIRDMEDPTNVTELRRFLGMTNQLGKFSDKIAEVSKPLRDLLSTKNSWVWESPQKESFKALN